MYDSDSSHQPHLAKTRFRLKRQAAFFVAALFGLFLVFTPNSADGAVELVFFKGSFIEAPNSVELEWKTSFESRTAGYFIKRKLSGSDEVAQIISVKLSHDASAAETNFIKAADDGTTGEDYKVYDFTMVQGETYEYSLWEQEFNASEPTQPEKVFELEASPQKVSSELSGDDQEQSQATATNTLTPSGSVTASAESTASTTTPTTPTATFPATSTPQGAASPTATTNAQNGEDGGQQPAPTFTPAPTQPAAATPITEESAPVQITPIATPTSSNDGVAEAAELPQEDTYPEPSPNSPDGSQSDQDYVPPATQTPLPISEQNAQPIGEGIEGQPIQPEVAGQAIDQIDPEEVSRNRIILWGGFLGSLLFFIAVMIGTILMYRQRQT